MEGHEKMTKLLLIGSLIFCLGIGDKRRNLEIERQLDILIGQLEQLKEMHKPDKSSKVLLITLAASWGVLLIVDVCYDKGLCDWRKWHRDKDDCGKVAIRKNNDTVDDAFRNAGD